MNRNSTEEEWLRWIEIQKSATYTWMRGDLPGAIKLIDDFVASNPPRDLKRQAIGFRGSLHQEQGDLMAAKSDFLTARDLSESRDYERCSFEESAGAVSYELGDKPEAEHWFLEALRTAIADPRSSGATALKSLLEIRGEAGLGFEERRLAEMAVKQAWQFHELPGSPNLDDLREASQVLMQAQSTPRRRGGEGRN